MHGQACQIRSNRRSQAANPSLLKAAFLQLFPGYHRRKRFPTTAPPVDRRPFGNGRSIARKQRRERLAYLIRNLGCG